jgi:hypothetical protein
MAKVAEYLMSTTNYERPLGLRKLENKEAIMKRLLTALVGLGLFFLCSGPSHAIPITETHSDTQSIYDFTGPIKFKGNYYLSVRDKSSLKLDHYPVFDPQGGSVKSGSMTMYYAQVSSNARAEQWSVFAGGEKIGDLVGGPTSNWQSQTFTLSPEVINSIMGSPFLGLMLVEGTKGADKFLLDKIVLSWELNTVSNGGTPAPVLEPSTMLLLGTGLVGLVGVRRRFRN